MELCGFVTVGKEGMLPNRCPGTFPDCAREAGAWGVGSNAKGKFQRSNPRKAEELDGQRTIHTRLEAVGTSHPLSIKLPFTFILHRGCER